MLKNQMINILSQSTQNKMFDELNSEEIFKKITNLDMQIEISNLN